MGHSLLGQPGDGVFGCMFAHRKQRLSQTANDNKKSFCWALVLILLYCTLRLRGEDEANRKLSLYDKIKRIDLSGTLFFQGAICCLLLAWQWAGESMPWNSPTVVISFVIFGALTAIYNGDVESGH